MTNQFGYRCQYCEGTVREKQVDREAFKHKAGFVILENVVIGICDKCSNRYYSADTLKRVHAIVTGTIPPDRSEQVPVAHGQ
jgi:YgiT-type zinc finger domain-containing protein